MRFHKSESKAFVIELGNGIYLSKIVIQQSGLGLRFNCVFARTIESLIEYNGFLTEC